MTEQEEVDRWCYLVGKALLKWHEIQVRLGHSCIANSFRYAHYPDDIPEDFKIAMEYVKGIIKNEHVHRGENLLKEPHGHQPQ